MIINRVKGFTIMEVIVAMLIGALLVGLTYESYQIISKFYRTFHAKNEEMASLERLDGLLSKDFATSLLIKKSDAQEVVFQRWQDSVRYQFSTDYVLRVSTITDTFRFKSTIPVTTFEDMPVDISPASAEAGRIDALSFDVTVENKLIPMRYHKTYSSVNLINRIPDANH
ncbi:MAG TPA: prepilin-type N-terminal cleavage/methylation domain-containing protein [Mucilaginibacter sp.]